jgi:hypothetical protein
MGGGNSAPCIGPALAGKGPPPPSEGQPHHTHIAVSDCNVGGKIIYVELPIGK